MAIIKGIFFSFSISSRISTKSPRNSCCKVTKYYMGSNFSKILGFQPKNKFSPHPRPPKVNCLGFLMFVVVVVGVMNLYRDWLAVAEGLQKIRCQICVWLQSPLPDYCPALDGSACPPINTNNNLLLQNDLSTDPQTPRKS
jgi:hypothetical protein